MGEDSHMREFAPITPNGIACAHDRGASKSPPASRIAVVWEARHGSSMPSLEADGENRS